MFDPKISHVLRELADWIEHRTDNEPSDTSRIELARLMATKVEKLEDELDQFKGALDRMAAEGQGELWTDAADETVAPFLVGQKAAEPGGDPVERCGCSKLTFSRDLMKGTLSATCDKGKTSEIQLDPIREAMLDPDYIISIVAQHLVEEHGHGLDVQALHEGLRKYVRSDPVAW